MTLIVTDVNKLDSALGQVHLHETFLWCNQLGHVDVVGSLSQHNKAKTLWMEHFKGGKFTEKNEEKIK